MKRVLLCCAVCWVLCFCIMPVGQAQTAAKTQEQQAASQPAPAPANDPDKAFARLHISDSEVIRLGAAGQDSLCANIRAYRVKREDRGSDAVSPAGYTTCVPATRFEFKSAVLIQSDGASR